MGVEPGIVFGVFIPDVITDGVEGLLQQPLIHMLCIVGIGDARCRRAAVDAGDVVLGGGAPVHLVGGVVFPPFNPGKQTLGARAIPVHRVEWTMNRIFRFPGFALPVTGSTTFFRYGTRSSAPDITNTSVSSYRGRPFSVLRVMRGMDSCQPKPNGPLPFPELYCRDRVGPKPPRPGEIAMGME